MGSVLSVRMTMRAGVVAVVMVLVASVRRRAVGSVVRLIQVYAERRKAWGSRGDAPRACSCG